MEKFNFISEEDFRNTLQADYDEMETCYNNKCWKSVLILSGSIIEATLIDYLIGLNNPKYKKQKLLQWDLKTAIKTCFGERIISEKAKNLSDVVKDYRNLIHPGRAIRTKTIVDDNDASVSKALVDIIIREISEKKKETYGYTAEQILNKIEKDSASASIWSHLLQNVNSNEKAKLLLSVLPNRYLELSTPNIFELDEAEKESKFNVLRKFFSETYNSVKKDIKKKVAQEFVRIIREGGDKEISGHIKYFFKTEYLQFIQAEDKTIVKKRLFSQLEANPNNEIFKSLDGIGKHLALDECENFIIPILRVAALEITPQKKSNYEFFANEEFQLMSNDVQIRTLEVIEEKINWVNSDEDMTDRLNYFKDFIQNPDPLPF